MQIEWLEQHPRATRFFVIAIGLLWLGLLAGDWYLRFHWFHWERQWMSAAAPASSGPYPALMDREAPPRRGGDLSNLLGLPAVARRFEEQRPASREVTDEFGYRNIPPTTGTTYDVLLTGSSYMNSGVPMTNMLSHQLAERLGRSVYCQGYPGMGPTIGLLRHLADPRFVQHPPRVLVWGFVEREIGGGPLVTMMYHIHRLGLEESQPATRERIMWSSFNPKYLKQGLPNSSALSQVSAKIWRIVRYHALGRVTEDVAISKSDIEGGPVLFYSEAVTAMRWTEEQRDLVATTRVFKEVQDLLRARGTALVMLLIPDKEQVYRENLPAWIAGPDRPIPPSCLIRLEQLLRENGIPVCNLLDTFRARAEQGELLYFRDDTHWNDRGVALAADQLAPVVESLLKSP